MHNNKCDTARHQRFYYPQSMSIAFDKNKDINTFLRSGKGKHLLKHLPQLC